MIILIKLLFYVIFYCKNATVASQPYTILETEAFYVPIEKHFFGQSISAYDTIEYLPSVSGMPDLPRWMFYRYPNNSKVAYLYGSPESDGDLEIDIVALNTYNYDTYRHSINFRVLAREKLAKYQVEMKFNNLNLEEMFNEVRIRDLLEIFTERLWEDSETVYITLIAAVTDLGGRVPVDPNDKEGVIVRIGSTDYFTNDLLDLERESERLKNRNPCPKKYKVTSAEYLFRNKDFHCDWCSFRLIRPNKEDLEQESQLNEITEATEQIPSVLINKNENEPKARPFPTKNYALDIIYCFVVPSIIGIMLISSLSCLLFSKTKEQIKEINGVQLEKYNSIQRASMQLRQLGINRDTLPSSNYSTLQRIK